MFVCLFFRFFSVSAIAVEHIYKRPEVNSNRFEISNRFEKLFCLHGNFTTANLEISKPLSKTVSFTWRFHCRNFPNHSKILMHMRK